MTKKISSIFLLLICLAIYDEKVKNVTEFSVNLDVLYHCAWLGFALFVAWLFWKESRLKFDKLILIILSIPFIVRIILNLLSINQEYEKYSSLVSNSTIDYITWMSLSSLLILISWQKFTA